MDICPIENKYGSLIIDSGQKPTIGLQPFAEYFIIPGTENYKALDLDLLYDQLESELEFIRIVSHREIEENHVRLHRGERTEEFDLTDDNFKEKMIKFLLP